MILAWLAAAWLAGIAACAVFGHGAWLLVPALACLAVAVVMVRPGRAHVLMALAVLLVFTGAVLRFEATRGHVPAGAISRFNDGVAMRVRGVVAGDPQIADTSQQLRLDVRDVQIDGAWRHASGSVLVRTGILPG